MNGVGGATVQGEDLGGWALAQRLDRDRLLPAQQLMLEHTLHLTPAEPGERPLMPPAVGPASSARRGARS